MRYLTFFISFEGRINRTQWWIGFTCLVFATLALIALAIDWEQVVFSHDASSITKFILIFFQLFPLTALNIKRFHDLNLSGVYAIFWPAMTIGHLLFGLPDANDLQLIFVLAEICAVAGSVGILGLVKGSGKPNCFGSNTVLDLAETAIV